MHDDDHDERVGPSCAGLVSFTLQPRASEWSACSSCASAVYQSVRMFVLLCNACTDVHEADTQSIVAACVNDFASATTLRVRRCIVKIA